jgi:pimeloyl-ACP methyl ester carboxylesterase
MLRTSILIGVAAVLYTLAGMYIAARDEAVLVKYPKPPVPAYGALKTITHGPAVMGNIAERSPGIAVDKFSASFDCYYEAQLDGCDSDKVFVMISGTNGASYLYRDIITDMRAKGYCTINFDHRAHGRSENAAGEYTAELLAEDAAALIRSVAPGKKVHLLGWSLGGAIAYYLGIYHPDIVASISVSGMTSCFGKITEDGECDMSFDYLKAFFSTEIMIRLLGSELQGRAAMAAISMHDNEANMYFWRTLKIDTW